MKATRNPPPAKFVPVTLVLETQAEVDAIFSVLNHCTVCLAIGTDNNEWETLRPFIDRDHAEKLHDALNALIKKGKL